MRFRSLLVPVFALTASLAGCYAERAYVVADAPPPARSETVVYRPGYVWVGGHWTRHGRRWAWARGSYVRERPNAVYVQGHWDRQGRNHVWVDGGWRARGRVTIRDQRY